MAVISGESMAPTIGDGELIFVNKLNYQFGKPKPGDVVMIDRGKEKLVKRVVAVGGDEVWTGGGYLYRNGERITEPYVKELMRVGVKRVKIPTDYVYVMGDNRNYSEDSRNFGPIPVSQIKGELMVK